MSEPARRIELRGVSVLPPKGENWFLAPKAAGNVPGIPGGVILAAFGKKPPDGQQRFGYAMVSVVDLGASVSESAGAYVRYVREEMKQATARQRVLDFEVSAASSPARDCARYRRTQEMDGNSIHLSAGIMCRHPHWSRYSVNISYGQRHLKGLQPLALEAEVEPFLSGVVFTPERPMVE